MKTRILCLALALVMLLSCLVGCSQAKSDETLIKERIGEFVSAFNDGDLEATMACLDRKTRNELEAWVNLMEMLVGKLTDVSFELSDLFAIGVGLGSSMGEGEDLLRAQIRKIQITGEGKAQARALLKSGDTTQAVCFEMVYEQEDWFIHDMVEDTDTSLEEETVTGGQPGQNQGSSGLKDTDTVVKLNSFTKDGRAVVEFKRSGTYMYGVIDTAGKMIYSSASKWTHIGGGAGYTQDKNGNIDIVNKDGKVTASSKDGLFDRVVAYGDGMVLVYQYKSGITSQSWNYGVLNSEGKWLFPMKDLGCEIGDHSAYLGSGVFCVYEGYHDRGYLLNCVSKTELPFKDDGNVYDLRFVNGVAYHWGTITLTMPNGTEVQSPDSYALKTDGTFEALDIDLSDDWYDIKSFVHKGYYVFTQEDYVAIQNLATGKTETFVDYPEDMVEGMIIDDVTGDILVTLRGVDGNDYFTVIDKNADMLFEPIRYIRFSNRTVYFSEGMICCNLASGGMAVVDRTGKTIVPTDVEYAQVYEFCNGIALVKEGDWDSDYKFIDKTGKVVLSDYAT